MQSPLAACRAVGGALSNIANVWVVAAPELFIWPTDALKGWRDFYLLVGTAGATLLALLFVAVSLGRGFLTEERQRETRTFMSRS
jgi:hypothetical protein